MTNSENSEKTRTNADKIRAMTDEEIVELLDCSCVAQLTMVECFRYRTCRECWLEWLRSPVEEGEK